MMTIAIDSTTAVAQRVERLLKDRPQFGEMPGFRGLAAAHRSPGTIISENDHVGFDAVCAVLGVAEEAEACPKHIGNLIWETFLHDLAGHAAELETTTRLQDIAYEATVRSFIARKVPGATWPDSHSGPKPDAWTTVGFYQGESKSVDHEIKRIDSIPADPDRLARLIYRKYSDAYQQWERRQERNRHLVVFIGLPLGWYADRRNNPADYLRAMQLVHETSAGTNLSINPTNLIVTTSYHTAMYQGIMRHGRIRPCVLQPVATAGISPEAVWLHTEIGWFLSCFYSDEGEAIRFENLSQKVIVLC